MRKIHRELAVAAAVLGIASVASAAIQINEVFTNPPGTDDTQEFFELKSTTGGVESMSGLTLLVIEGETTSAGVIDQALSLSSFSTGTNGLFYWRANAAVGSFNPAPDAASTVNTADFLPDLENGTQTYLLVSGFTGAVTNDIDTNNDGNVDVMPWTSVVDAIGVFDNTLSGDWGYAGDFGFAEFPTAPSGFEAETIFRLTTGEWVASDIAGTNPGGPYTYDGLETIYTNGSTVPVASMDFDDVSPGRTNPTIPEPATLGLIGSVAMAFGRRRGRP